MYHGENLYSNVSMSRHTRKILIGSAAILALFLALALTPPGKLIDGRADTCLEFYRDQFTDQSAVTLVSSELNNNSAIVVLLGTSRARGKASYKALCEFEGQIVDKRATGIAYHITLENLQANCYRRNGGIL